MNKLTLTHKLACETGLEFPFLLEIKEWHLTQNIEALPLTVPPQWDL